MELSSSLFNQSERAAKIHFSCLMISSGANGKLLCLPRVNQSRWQDLRYPPFIELPDRLSVRCNYTLFSVIFHTSYFCFVKSTGSV
ncbi:hypothetical protein GN956_G11189 [Arapaima gigas]